MQRPRHHRETFQIGLELEVPGNVWGIDAPPADWFPHPDDLLPTKVVEPIARVAPEPRVSAKGISVVEATPAKTPEVVPQKPTAARAWETLHLPEPEPIVSRPTKSTDPTVLRGLIGETVKATTDAMIEEKIALMRKHFTGRLEFALVETLKTFSDLTTEIVKEARRASTKEVQAELQKFVQQVQKTVTEMGAASDRARNGAEQVQTSAREATPARAASTGEKNSAKRRKKTAEPARQ